MAQVKTLEIFMKQEVRNFDMCIYSKNVAHIPTCQPCGLVYPEYTLHKSFLWKVCMDRLLSAESIDRARPLPPQILNRLQGKRYCHFFAINMKYMIHLGRYLKPMFTTKLM